LAQERRKRCKTLQKRSVRFVRLLVLKVSEVSVSELYNTMKRI